MGSSSADHHWLKSADWDSLANGKLQPRELLHRWIERNDARNYVVLGDPAVSIRHNDLQALP